ncbi:hypothetical protein MAR_016803 [Mya arenaria]|uniref:Uncharacterized protein n=1 Tax=Mya arenaria TaxID=6604 RepID=A0ABY7E9Y2_MYAAR|nr:hypothetical protein MAR_016803 [Mya arenaria]
MLFLDKHKTHHVLKSDSVPDVDPEQHFEVFIPKRNTRVLSNWANPSDRESNKPVLFNRFLGTIIKSQFLCKRRIIKMCLSASACQAD